MPASPMGGLQGKLGRYARVGEISSDRRTKMEDLKGGGKLGDQPFWSQARGNEPQGGRGLSD